MLSWNSFFKYINVWWVSVWVELLVCFHLHRLTVNTCKPHFYCCTNVLKIIFFLTEHFLAQKISFHTYLTKRSTLSPTRGKDLMKDCGRLKTTQKLSSQHLRYVFLLFFSTKDIFSIYHPDVDLRLGLLNLPFDLILIIFFILSLWPNIFPKC